MANFLAPIINGQQFDANGDPLSSGTIEVYLAGTSTPATTYTTQAGGTPNTFPIDLNTLGVNEDGEIWLIGGASYKFVIKDSGGVTLRTLDNMSGINDSAITTDQWLVYQATPTYVSATSFTVVGDQTQTFQVGRRIKSTNTGGTVYSTITGSVFSSPNTTITVRNDSGTLDSGLSQVSYGVMSVLQTSLPGGMINYGQCRLTKSGANLLLSPFNGNRITINGSVCVIPSAGVTLAPTSLSVGTTYYIYAFMSGATLTLEASATTHATDATTGVEVKSGDATRTLVGMARVITGPAWADAGNQRFVISWFNRRPINCSAALSVDAGLVSTTYAEIAAAVRNEFLIWSGDSARFGFEGTCHNNVAHTVSSTIASVDGGTAHESYSAAQHYQVAALVPISCSLVLANGSVTEGYHYVTALGKQNAVSTTTYIGSGTTGARCALTGIIQG